MVSREDLLKYGTLALILFFVFEAFFPLLYAPASSDASASPTPLPSGASFQATGTTRANVTRLENVGFAPCDPSLAADKALLNESGVKQAYYSASNALAVEFLPNASVSAIGLRVLQLCQAPMYRVAVVEPGDVTLKGGNKTQTVTVAQFRSLEAQTGLPGLRAFILPETALGAVITVTISGTISNGQLSSLIVEETAPPQVFLPSPTAANTSDSNSGRENQNATPTDNETLTPGSGSLNESSNPTTSPTANQSAPRVTAVPVNQTAAVSAVPSAKPA